MIRIRNKCLRKQALAYNQIKNFEEFVQIVNDRKIKFEQAANEKKKDDNDIIRTLQRIFKNINYERFEN